MKATRPSLVLSVLAALAIAAPAGAQEPKHTAIPADKIKWGPAPPSLPPGAQAAVLMGDPGKEGPFVIRVKMPAGYVVPPHSHSKDEVLTVISGKMKADHGEKVEKKGALPAGSLMAMPAGMVHYAWAESPSVIQVNGTGPFDVKYVDPKDDPRNKPAAPAPAADKKADKKK